MSPTRSKIMQAVAAAFLCASAASAQNLTIASGNGQVICPACVSNLSEFYQPLVVQATDANGNPLSGVTVNWSVTANPFGYLNGGGTTYSTSTDSTGHAYANFVLNSTLPVYGNALNSFAQSTVVASTTSSSVSFYVTVALQDPVNGNQSPVYAIPLNNSVYPDETFTGQSGTTSSTPIQIAVLSEAGPGVPNVAVFLVDSLSNGGSIECAPSPGAGANVVLTNSTGLATCYPVFGGAPASGGIFWIDIGGAQTSSTEGAIDPTQAPPQYLAFPSTPYLATTQTGEPLNFTVTPGAPGAITSVSGTGQSANPGQALSQPLVVQVLNASNQPLSGVTVNWSVSPSNAATFATTTTTTSSNGQSSNTVTLTISAAGTITVTATPSGSSSKATFTITAVPLVTITSFTIVSGNNQSAAVGTAFAQPLVVQVASSAGAASGVVVNFQVQSGSVILSAPSATTNASGQAQVTATAGSLTGGATVVASLSSASGSSSQTFNLTVLPQGPTITASSFYNGADLQPNSLAPCGIGALVGNSLGVSNLSPGFFGLPLTSPYVSLSFNSISAPILTIGNTASGAQEILFQVPCTLSPGSSVPVTVSINGSTSNVNLNIKAAAPGIYQTTQSDGVVRAVILRPDGSFASPSNPARRGETEIAYVTGLGATSPAVATGDLPVPGGAPANVLGTVIPGMTGGGVPLVSAEASPDIPGVYLVAFQIPQNEATGDVSFSIGIIPQGGTAAAYTALSKIPVQ